MPKESKKKMHNPVLTREALIAAKHHFDKPSPKAPESWEEQFDDEFYYLEGAGDKGNVDQNNVKDFIKQQLSTQKSRIVDVIENMKIREKGYTISCPRNDVLKEVLKSINKIS